MTPWTGSRDWPEIYRPESDFMTSSKIENYQSIAFVKETYLRKCQSFYHLSNLRNYEVDLKCQNIGLKCLTTFQNVSFANAQKPQRVVFNIPKEMLIIGLKFHLNRSSGSGVLKMFHSGCTPPLLYVRRVYVFSQLVYNSEQILRTLRR